MFRGFVCGTKDVNATLSLFIPTLSNLRRPHTKSVVIKTIKSFIYHSPNSTAQIYIYNYDNLLCDQNMDGGDCAAMLVSVGVVQMAQIK